MDDVRTAMPNRNFVRCARSFSTLLSEGTGYAVIGAGLENTD